MSESNRTVLACLSLIGGVLALGVLLASAVWSPEAMAEGVPVLATPVGGIVDLIEDGQTGYLLPDGDEDTIAAAIARVMARSDRDSVARTGQTFVRATYSLENARRVFRDNLTELCRTR